MIEDPWIARFVHDLSNPMVVATTASRELRHGSVSGTLAFANELALQGRAISRLIAGVSQLRMRVLHLEPPSKVDGNQDTRIAEACDHDALTHPADPSTWERRTRGRAILPPSLEELPCVKC